MPIICPTRSRGASFVIDDSPTGDRLSSPTVWKKYVTMSHDIETLFCADALAAPHDSTKNPAAKPIRPIANFTGIDGFALRRASAVHTQPNTGAKMMMKIGLMFCSHPAGIAQPNTVRLVRSRAKRFSDDPACSNPDQNTAASTNSQKITISRLFVAES